MAMKNILSILTWRKVSSVKKKLNEFKKWMKMIKNQFLLEWKIAFVRLLLVFANNKNKLR